MQQVDRYGQPIAVATPPPALGGFANLELGPPLDLTSAGASSNVDRYGQYVQQPLDAMDRFSEAMTNWERQIPYLASALEAKDLYQLHDASKALEAGTASPEQEKLLFDFLEKAQAPKTLGYKVVDILAQIVPFVGEMAGGVAVGRKLLGKTVAKAIGEAAEKGATRTLAKKLASGAAKTAAIVGTEAAVSSAIGAVTGGPMGGRITADAYRRATAKGGMQLTEDDAGRLSVTFNGTVGDFMDSLPQAVASQVIEVGSELAGGALLQGAAKVPGLAKVAAAQKSVMDWWLKKYPKSTVREFVQKVAQEGGWNGPVGEYLEERAGAAARALVPGMEEDFGDIFPSLHDQAAELIAFSIPTGVGIAASAATDTSRAELPDRAGPTQAGKPATPVDEYDVPRAAAPMGKGSRPVLDDKGQPTLDEAGKPVVEAFEAPVRHVATIEDQAASDAFELNKALAADLGVELVPVSSEDGAPLSKPAQRDAKEAGRVYWDVNQVRDGETGRVIHDAGIHELADVDPQTYADLQTYFEETFSDTERATILDDYAKRLGQKVPDSIAAEETLANFAERLGPLVVLSDTQNGRAFLEQIARNDFGLFQRVVDWVKRLSNRVLGTEFTTKIDAQLATLLEPGSKATADKRHAEAALVIADALQRIQGRQSPGYAPRQITAGAEAPTKPQAPSKTEGAVAPGTPKPVEAQPEPKPKPVAKPKPPRAKKGSLQAKDKAADRRDATYRKKERAGEVDVITWLRRNGGIDVGSEGKMPGDLLELVESTLGIPTNYFIERAKNVPKSQRKYKISGATNRSFFTQRRNVEGAGWENFLPKLFRKGGRYKSADTLINDLVEEGFLPPPPEGETPQSFYEKGDIFDRIVDTWSGEGRWFPGQEDSGIREMRAADEKAQQEQYEEIEKQYDALREEANRTGEYVEEIAARTGREWLVEQAERMGFDPITPFAAPARRLAADGEEDASRFAAAFHGSPHDFDRFDLSKIGTGEGAQAFGYGLYFASKRGIAEHYKERFERTSRAHSTWDGRRLTTAQMRAWWQSSDPLEVWASTWLASQVSPTSLVDQRPKLDRRISDLTQEKGKIRARLEERQANPPIVATYSNAELLERIEGLDREIERTEMAKSRLGFQEQRKSGAAGYVVELAPQEDEYLLWDELLDEQPDRVQKALAATDWYADALEQIEDRSFDNPTGQSLVRWLEEDFDPSEASRILHEAGIRGTKYLDGTSRSKGEGSYNYVLFDDKDVTITDRFAAKPSPDQMGFYSGVEAAALRLADDAQKSYATGIVRARLKKYGAKDEELDWMGLDAWLKSLPKGTKLTAEEIAAFVKENVVVVREEVLSYEDETSRHNDYQLPGGENYRELLLTLPPSDATPTFDANKKSIEQMNLERDAMGEAPLTASEIADLRARGNPLESELAAYKASPSYTGGHYGDTPNVLAHVRFNEREGPNGERILFIEEIQSDWHQAGAKGGYATKPRYRVQTITGTRVLKPGGKDGPAVYDTLEEAQALADKHEGWIVKEVPGKGVPDAPFKQSWPTLAMKRMVRWAAENGFDEVAWTPGVVQVDRYSNALRQAVDAIQWEPMFSEELGDHKIVSASKGGSSVIEVAVGADGKVAKSNVSKASGKDLSDVVGKAIAERVLSEDSGKVEGDDLTIGGKGMEAFYDRRLVETARKLGKPFGGKVGRTALQTEGGSEARRERAIGLAYAQGQLRRLEEMPDTHPTRRALFNAPLSEYSEDAIARRRAKHQERIADWTARVAELATAPVLGKPLPVHSLRITDKMRESVTQEGFSRFAAAPAVDSPQFKRWFGDSKVVDADGKPLVVFHGTVRHFARFDPKRRGGLGGAIGFWFASEPGSVAPFQVVRVPTEDRPQTMPVYLSLQQPMEFDSWEAFVDAGRATGKKTVEEQLRSLRRSAVRAGYDGFIIRSSATDGGGVRDDYVAFRPEQIKSIHNRGTWDSTDPDIRHAAPGAPSFFRPGAGEVGLPWRRYDSLLRTFQNKYVAVNRLEEVIGGDEAPVSESIIRFPGRTEARLSQFERKVNRMLRKAKGSGITAQELGEFAQAKHALERDDAIAARTDGKVENGSGMKPKRREEILSKWSDNAKMLELWNGLRALADETLDMRVAYGLMTQDHADTLRKLYPNYVPLMTDLSDMGDMPAGSTGKGFHLRGSDMKGAKGRGSEADNPLPFLLIQRERTIIRGEKNIVDLELLNALRAEKEKGAGKWTISDKDPLSTESGLTGKDALKDKMTLAERTVSAWENGKQVHITFDADLQAVARAMKNLSDVRPNGILGALQVVNRILSSVNTSLNPEFLMTNFARDVQTALVNMGDAERKAARSDVVRGIPRAIRAIWNVERQNRKDGDGDQSEAATYYREMVDNGGKVGWWMTADFTSKLSAIERVMNEEGTSPQEKALRAGHKFFDVISDANMAVEQGVRLSYYMALRKRGVSAKKASVAAKELTVNFNTKGEAGVMMNALYLFYNAGVQGNARMIRALVKSPEVQKIATGIVVSGIVLDLINRAVGGDDDDGENFYEKIPAHLKERNLIFMDPSGSGEYVKIPMPYGYNVIQNLGRVIGEALPRDMMGGGQNPMDSALSLANAAWSSFNPLGSEGSALQFLAPTVLDPMVQVAENKTWYGGPIMPEDRGFGPEKPDSQLAFKSVGPLPKAIAEALNKWTGGNDLEPGAVDVSPETLEHYYDFVSGGVGRLLSRGSKVGEWIATGEPMARKDMPFVRVVSGEPDPNHVQRRFYENLLELERFELRLKQLRETGFGKEANQLRRERRAQARFAGPAGDLRLRIRDLRKQTASAPKERKAVIEKRMDRLMRDFNRKYLQAIAEPPQ